MKLNEKLILLRKKAGLSQQELAEKLFLSRQSISKWESGAGTPSSENLVNIGNLFHVTIDSLLDDEAELQYDSEPNPTKADCSGNNRNKPRIKHSLIAICVLVLFTIAVSAFYADMNNSNDEIPMAELERDKIDILSTEEFQVEPLQP